MVGNRFTNPVAEYPIDPNKKIGFQDVNKEVVATRGVKLKNKAAEAKEKAKKDKQEYLRKFDRLADNTIKHYNDTSNRAINCISKYIKICEDKTLAENRSGIVDDVEREIRQDIIQLALDLNNDENEPDNGKGSVVVISALTKILMLYRDRINKLEYEIYKLKSVK